MYKTFLCVFFIHGKFFYVSNVYFIFTTLQRFLFFKNVGKMAYTYYKQQIKMTFFSHAVRLINNVGLLIYTVSQKTSCYNLAHNLPKCWLIFDILPLADSLVNLQQNLSNDTLNVLLHYLVKYLCSKNCHAQDLSEASCHAKLSHSKQLLKNFLPWF